MIEFSLALLSALLAVPVIVLFVQVVMAISAPEVDRYNVPEDGASVIRGKYAVLVPAHDEESVIAETINALQAQLHNEGRLLVIADNCSDRTAEIAESMNAEVINRVDKDNRGKGYALDFGMNRISQDDDVPDVIVVIDADCIVQEHCLNRLIGQCIQTGRPAQALYLMTSESEKLGRKIAQFAWIVKNRVRALGNLKLGLPCQLAGTGMAFPYQMMASVDLANADLVEDMKLGINMARAGCSPMFCPGAVVVSSFPDEEQGIDSQRTRWEHGHLGTIIAEGPGLIALAIKKRDINMVALALDLMVPPLALLSILLAIVLVVTGVYHLLAAKLVPFLITLGAMSLFALSVLLAQHRFASHVLSLKDLLGVPVYIARKIPLYFRFWTRRQKEWVRTDRN